MAIRIASLQTNAGFLQNAPISFAPGLTCIIGARGTCKSTVIETIRFAFNCDPKRVEALLETSNSDSSAQHGLIKATLGEGMAQCIVMEETLTGKEELSIERDCLTPPRIYRQGVQEIADVSILDQVEIYSQGDLQQIAEHNERRLDLIDRPHKTTIDELNKERNKNASSLASLGPVLREQRANIEALKADIQGLPELQSRLTTLQSTQPKLPEELETERQGFLERKNILDQFHRALQTRDSILSSLQMASMDTIDLSMLDEHVAQELEAEQLIKGLREFQAFLSQNNQAIVEQTKKSLQAPLAQLASIYEQKNTRYYTLLQDAQTVNESLKQEDALKQGIAQRLRLQEQLTLMEKEVQNLLIQRNEFRERIAQINDEIYGLRTAEAQKINDRCGDQVVLAIDRGNRSGAYVELLLHLLSGSGLRGQEEIVHDLAEKVRAADLIDIVETGESQRLTDLLNRDLGQMSRLITHLFDVPDLYQLEGVIPEDQLEITLYDGAISKSISQLSSGQMATALLPLIMRPADYPLIFDQPEDDLDNRFIYTTLVDQIRSLKIQRQLIFVTHNANIPVLGEADKVVVMDMENPMLAAVPKTGSIDEMKGDILSILEGGAKAFMLRQEKYHDLLSMS